MARVDPVVAASAAQPGAATRAAAVWPGSPYPLGATWDGLGVNFAVFSADATRVDVCLFNSNHTADAPSLVVLRVVASAPAAGATDGG